MRDLAHADPPEGRVELLGSAALTGVQQQQRESLLAGTSLELLHQRAGEAAPSRMFVGFSTQDLHVAKAVNHVVVYQAHRLHERVTDRRSHKLETSVQQIATERV